MFPRAEKAPHNSVNGQVKQSGRRGVQTVAPKSITA